MTAKEVIARRHLVPVLGGLKLDHCGTEIAVARLKAHRLDFHRELSEGHIRIGDLHLGQGRAHAALLSFWAGLNVVQEAAAGAPDDPQLQSDLASSLERMAQVDEGSAVDWLRRAVDIRRTRLAAEPKNMTASRELAVALLRLGHAWSRISHEPTAKVLQNEARSLLRDLHDRGVLNKDLQSILEGLEALTSK